MALNTTVVAAKEKVTKADLPCYLMGLSPLWE